ncbi:MAG: InlB B-repeat-containing protein [Spirochaetia bacterium]|nr:InlB B-repeat-containing protein [Spirochaetia bacterium]
MFVSSSSMGAPSASGSYLQITGLTQRGKQLAELKITETIDGFDVTSIKARAFRSCSNIRKVTVAGSVRSIGDWAFAGCSNLESLVMKGNVPPEMGVGVLDFCPAVISVPPSAKEAYINNDSWNSYSTQIVTYYTVSFRSDNADIAAYPSEKQVVSPAKTIDVLPSDPIRSGYIFGGWYTGPSGTGTLFTATTEVTSDLTVYAKWTPVSNNTGTRVSFSIIGFRDARVPSHLFQSVTPDLNATYYYKATPRWTTDLKTVTGATKDFVQLPYNYSIKTRTIEMGLFTPGAWDFEVRVVSSKGIILYEKKNSNCTVNSQRSTVIFMLEKHYEGNGTLHISAVSDAVSSEGGMRINYSQGTLSKTVEIPMADSLPGPDGTVIFKKTLSLPPGFYAVDLTLYDGHDDKAFKSGYVEVFGNETSVLNSIVYEDTWMVENYTDVMVLGGFLMIEKRRLGMIVSTNGNIYSRTWTVTARQPEDSEEIKAFVWYVNGIKQNETGPELLLRNLDSRNYYISCYAFDNTLSYIVSAGFDIPVR